MNVFSFSFFLQEFSADIVEELWQNACNTNPQVAMSAFKALAQFDPELFTIKHLPVQVCRDLLEQARAVAAAAAAEGPAGFEVEPETPDIAGYCYTRLMKLSTHDKELIKGMPR